MKPFKPRKTDRKIVKPGKWHYLYLEANTAQYPLFPTPVLMGEYYGRLAERAEECGVRVGMVALFQGQIHLAMKPNEKDSFARLFSTLNSQWARRIQQRLGYEGRIFYGPYVSVVLEKPIEPKVLQHLEGLCQQGAAEEFACLEILPSKSSGADADEWKTALHSLIGIGETPKRPKTVLRSALGRTHLYRGSRTLPAGLSLVEKS